MVAVGDDKKPASIPPLVPSTPDEVRRFEEAKGRRDLRLALERDHAQRISSKG